MTEYTVKVDPNGTREWYLNDQLHREDGPAAEYASGGREWWLNGKLHREDGPAVEYASGTRYWYLNGERHRTDGPAIEWADGGREWWLNGKELTQAEFNQKIALKELTVAEIEALLGYPVKIIREQNND